MDGNISITKEITFAILFSVWLMTIVPMRMIGTIIKKSLQHIIKGYEGIIKVSTKVGNVIVKDSISILMVFTLMYLTLIMVLLLL